MCITVICRERYTVGWICAISTEYVAAQQFLDEVHDQLEVAENDDNNYALGRIGQHHTVIATLPDGEYGISSAAVVATNMLNSFPSIRIGLMVGISGGAPSASRDIRLGDIVVSSPCDGKGGVYQYNYGKAIQNQEFKHTGFLNQPPRLLRGAVSSLKAKYEVDGHDFEEDIRKALERKPRLRKKYGRPDAKSDRLYQSNYVHLPHEDGQCTDLCHDQSKVVQRSQRTQEDDNPAIHYGLIASADTLMKDANVRDTLAHDSGVLCFEMEAAGLVNHFPCLVIRGICDYADSHKNEEWQGYAAMTAAAYAKDLLKRITPTRISSEKRIADALNDMNEQLGNFGKVIHQTSTKIHNLGQRHHHEEINHWLKAPDVSLNYEKARAQRHPSSGSWYLDSRAYEEWRTQPNSLSWLFGIPGCGKTVLSSTIIENLSAYPTLYFFFDYNDSGKQWTDNMVRSLISQLYYVEPDTQTLVNAFFTACNEGRTQPSTEKLCATFLEMLHTTAEICIVIDALDECRTRFDMRGLLGVFPLIEQVLITEHPGRHVLITSRDEEDIRSSLTDLVLNTISVPIQGEGITNDIHRYVCDTVCENQKLRRWRSRPDVQDEIVNQVTHKSGEMFRLAACQLDSLEDCLDYRSILSTLETLPTTLEDMYSRILDRIPASYRANTTRILQFLIYSKRPLSVREAVDAIVVDIDSNDPFEVRNRMPEPFEIMRYCSSLVTITNGVSGGAYNSDDSEAYGSDEHEFYDSDSSYIDVTTDSGHNDENKFVLQIAHFSVREYLISEHVHKEFTLKFEESIAKACNTRVCLSYLSNLDHDLSLEEIRRSWSFAEYAARHWISFAESVQEDPTIRKQILNFLTCSRQVFKNCFELYNLGEPKPIFGVQKPPSALYYASLTGLNAVVEDLVAEGVEVDARGGFCGSALQASALQGNEEAARILLQGGASVNAQGGRYGTALVAASRLGHERTVRILLDRGANVDAKSDYSGASALYEASSRGHEKIVHILIDGGADINCCADTLYGTALAIACAKGHQNIIQTLLDRGAKIHIRGKHRDINALHIASENGYKEIVSLLLSAGADVNAQVYDDRLGSGNALEAASANGHEMIVLMLLDNGVDVNTQHSSSDYGNALQVASEMGYERIVHMLLDNGAYVNAQCRGVRCVYNNALVAASGKGHERIVQILIEGGADVNAQDDRGPYNNALQAASDEGHEKVVQRLLDSGADVNAKATRGFYNNALEAASAEGRERVVQLLLGGGVNVNAQSDDSVYKNALDAASKRGHCGVVKLLLEHGATEASEHSMDAPPQEASHQDYIEDTSASVLPLVGQFDTEVEP